MKLLTSIKMVYASLRIVKDPRRLDEVIELADALAEPEVMQTFVDAARNDPQAARALVDRPRVRIDMKALRELPRGTLGREFAEHMIANGLDPDALPNRPANDEAQFIQAHLFETHDIWHVVTGLGTDVAGELGLQAFYLAQLPNARLAPALLAVGMLNTFLYAMNDSRARLDAISHGWELGKRARPLFGIDWNVHWSRPIAEVRNDLQLAA